MIDAIDESKTKEEVQHKPEMLTVKEENDKKMTSKIKEKDRKSKKKVIYIVNIVFLLLTRQNTQL